MTAPLQPLLHSATVVLRAPVQAWSSAAGSMGEAPIHGLYLADTRIVSALSVSIGGARDAQRSELIATVTSGADSVSFVALERGLDDPSPDPRVRSVHERTVTIDGCRESVRLESTRTEALETTIVVRLQSDLATMGRVKDGSPTAPVALAVTGATASWGSATVAVNLAAPGATLSIVDGVLEAAWTVTVAAKSAVSVGWSICARDSGAVVHGAETPARWSVPVVRADDERMSRWLTTALDDLDSLRLTTTTAPGAEFLAAGAPWFFTLFGRDSIWAARFMLPLGTELAEDTLRVLAGLQGTASVAATAEQPGKIMHELRSATPHGHTLPSPTPHSETPQIQTRNSPGENDSLPPLYYGTVDATPLWICLLHDAWRWGMPDPAVEAMLPHLRAALAWMRDFGDSDGDGLLEYVDSTGSGLANQGWKDSADSVQWRDGTRAEGPIALCEVQGYAFEAAMHGADLLEHFGFDGAHWRAWAQRLRTRFHASFWIDDPAGAYPAIALDASKHPVDTVTSNIGHLLGTGILDHRHAALVARRLVSPELNSGFGLRTMSTESAGYWPLSYHGGSVWSHDTSIAIAGLTREGFVAEAAILTRGLLAAAAGFHYRMPELHSGDSAGDFAAPIPYPAACRPQAWSAAAAVSVLASALGLRADAPSGVLGCSPSTVVGALAVSRLRFGGAAVSITVNSDGEVTGSSGAVLQVE